MTVSFVCVVTHGKKKEMVPRGNSFYRRKAYWFYADGTPFPSGRIHTQWSFSTLSGLNEDSGGFLDQICGADRGEMMVRLNTRRVSRLIKMMKRHVARTAATPAMEKNEVTGMPYVTIHNLITTFDKMVAKYGDNARFCIG